MAVLKIYCFGGLKLLRDDRPISVPLLKKTQAFLVYLAVERDKIFTRDKLCNLFWPESGESQAKYNLRYTLWVLRTGLGFPQGSKYEFITTYQDRCKFNIESNYWLDTEKFEQRLILAKNLKIDDTQRVGYLTDAVNLYQGDFLDGFFIKGSWEFENWQRIQRERFFQKFTEAVINLADLLIAQKEYQKAVDIYRHALFINPLQEGFHQELIRLYLLIGDRSKAMEQYERCREVLKKEMGLTPTPETQELRRSIFKKEGKGEEKEVEGEKQIGEGNAKFDLEELLKEVPAGWRLRHPKGVEPPFVAREKELAELNTLLKEVEKGTGLEAVIIKGELGIGKTRLIEEFLIQNEARAEIIYTASLHISPSNPLIFFMEGGRRWFKRKLVSGILTGDENATGYEHKIKQHFLAIQSAIADNPNKLLESIGDLFSFAASLKPLILVVEDIHWMSPPSLDMLYYLISKCLHQKILFIGSVRPEDVEAESLAVFIGKLQRILKLKKISLNRLSYEDVQTLLEKHQSQSPGIADWTDTVYYFSDGNPFIMSLLINEISFPEFKSNLTIPETISDIFIERLSRLSDKAVYLLKLAAVLGISPKQKDLLTVSKMAGREFITLTAELIKRGFFKEKVEQGEARFTFTHPFLPELILSQMTVAEKSFLQEMCINVLYPNRAKVSSESEG